MHGVTTIGLDIAKSVFQVHGIDATGKVVIRRQLKRRYVLAFFEKLAPCLVGIEACASSHHWSRELQALGHTVRLILLPPGERIHPQHNLAIIRYEGRDARDRHRAECGWSDRAGVASGSADCSIAKRRQGSLAAMLNATEEERREAVRESHRKYREANREAIKARQAERDRKKRAAMKAGQNEI